jgi:YkoY family integral membrane protein
MDILREFLGNDIESAVFIIINLILIESLLSVDNAAVLATMVMDLPENQRNKALKYGILGAYFFRGLSLVFASYLIHIWWLKPLGGLYLMYLCISYFISKDTPEKSDDVIDKNNSLLYAYTLGLLGPFWATVAMVEMMDMAFSIDNVFAAVAFTDNIYLICTGVFIGILAMRLVAQGFVKLMQRFPFLESSAFIVIGILGIKLSVSVYTHFFPNHTFSLMLDSEKTDLYVSLLTVAIFFMPLLIVLIKKK